MHTCLSRILDIRFWTEFGIESALQYQASPCPRSRISIPTTAGTKTFADMGRGPGLSEKEEAEIRALASTGVRPNTIAKRVKRSRTAVRNVLARDVSTRRPKPRGPPRKLSPGVVDAVLKKSKEGALSARQLRDFFDLPVTVRSVQGLLQKSKESSPTKSPPESQKPSEETPEERKADENEEVVQSKVVQSKGADAKMQRMKVSFRGEIRRLGFPSASGIGELMSVLAGMFSSPECPVTVSDFSVRYMDDEGDWVRLSSDAELLHAIENAEKGLLRLEMVPVQQNLPNVVVVSSMPQPSLSTTPGVMQQHPSIPDEGTCPFTT